MQWDSDRNKWMVRWREAGRQRVKRFTLQGDAILFEATMVRRRQLGDLATERLAGEMTLGEWVTDRYIPEHQAHLAPNTRRWQAELWDNHVGELEHVRLKDLSASVIRRWQTERDKAGAGRIALRRSLQWLGSILQHALEADELAANPVRAVKPLPKHPERAVRAFSPHDVELIRAQLSKPRDRLLVSVLAYGGLRPAEATAMEGERILARTMVIDQAADGEGGLKDTKTGATRAVRLLPALAEDLAQGAAGRGPIFSTPAHPAGGWSKGTWANWRFKVWKPAIEAALGVYVKPYDLRHSFASLLLAEGKTIHYVAGQMGHSAEETMNTYGHLIAEFEGETIDAQEQIAKARAQVWGTETTKANA